MYIHMYNIEVICICIFSIRYMYQCIPYLGIVPFLVFGLRMYDIYYQWATVVLPEYLRPGTSTIDRSFVPPAYSY